MAEFKKKEVERLAALIAEQTRHMTPDQKYMVLGTLIEVLQDSVREIIGTEMYQMFKSHVPAEQDELSQRVRSELGEHGVMMVYAGAMPIATSVPAEHTELFIVNVGKGERKGRGIRRGYASYFRLLDPDGKVLVQGNIASRHDPEANASIVMDNLWIEEGQEVTFTDLTIGLLP